MSKAGQLVENKIVGFLFKNLYLKNYSKRDNRSGHLNKKVVPKESKPLKINESGENIKWELKDSLIGELITQSANKNRKTSENHKIAQENQI